MNDPAIDTAVAQGWIPGAPGKGFPPSATEEEEEEQQQQQRGANNEAQASTGKDCKTDMNLESMVRAVVHLDLDEQGHWDYHGHSSGLTFVRRMREQLGDLMGPETIASPFVKSRPMSQLLDSPKSSLESPMGENAIFNADLPPRATAVQLCQNAIIDAGSLLRIVHEPTFWQSFESIYNKPSEHYGNEDHVFLPLFYSAMATGCLFGKDQQSSLIREGYESAIQQGFSYFKTARHMMDIGDCRDLSSIQAVCFMIVFLQSSAKLSQCYAYVGVALRSALRMGLHRSAVGKFGPIEAETRKRVFWVIRKMDIYVGAMLGLPQTLSDDDIDQELPLEVDDEYITTDGILPMPEGTVSMMASFNAHNGLVRILSKIVRYVYPIKVQNTRGSCDKSYSVPFSAIREIEGDLEQWKNSLPSFLSPSEAPSRYQRIQQLLRMSYAHAQVMLYRPFLHFTAMDKRNASVDKRAYACAASFVNVSRNIIHITIQMKQKGLLNGAYWFVMYTAFFSVLALVYYAAENPDNNTSEAVMKDAIDGKDILAALAKRSLAADRCSATLDEVFKRLPPWMRDRNQTSINSRKRSHQPSPRPYQLGEPQMSGSQPDVSKVSPEPHPLSKRATTFPTLSKSLPTNGASPLGSSWSQSTSSYAPNTPSSTSVDLSTFARLNQQNAASSIHPDLQAYEPPPVNFANPALSDLSSIMFPTADEPLLYPNQPLTTFENNQRYAKNGTYFNHQPFGSPNGATSPPPPSRGGHDENIEAQFFALPPYIEQQQQNMQTAQPQPHHPYYNQQQQQQHNSGMSFAQASPFDLTQSMSSMPNGDWPDNPPDHLPQDVSSINIQDLFGGAEWNPMLMHPRYQQ